MNQQDEVGQWNMELNASQHFYVADVSFYLILSPVQVCHKQHMRMQL